MKTFRSWMGLLALCATACTSPTPGGAKEAPATQPAAPPSPAEVAAAFEGCRSQPGQLDIWCGDVVFVPYQQPAAKEELQQTMASLRDRIAEQPDTQLKLEGPVMRQRIGDFDVLRIRYRYVWEGTEYVAQTFGRSSSTGNIVADCAAPASQQEAIARCLKIGVLAVTRPREEINAHIQPEQGVKHPRSRFDDAGRTCHKREQPGIVAFACKDGSGYVKLDPKAGAPAARELVTTMGGRGGTVDAGEVECVVASGTTKCRRFTCKGGPSECELLVAPLGMEPGAGEAICVLPPGTKELPSICQDTFKGFGPGTKPR